MRTKNFLIFVLSVFVLSTIFIIFNNERPDTIQNIVTTTHQQIRNFKDTLRDAERKSFSSDEKYLSRLGLTPDTRRIFPNAAWHNNTTLPVIVTYVLEGQESQVVGFVNNVARILPNSTVMVYNFGLGSHSQQVLINYCNSTKCLVIPFKLNDFPSHVEDSYSHAYRPLIIQDALQNVGAVFFMEAHMRFRAHVTASQVAQLYDNVVGDASASGIVTWEMPAINAVSSLTHKKMFDYFHKKAEDFLFVHMVSADTILLVNSLPVHTDIMLPWVQCALTQDCIVPIGAQSGGCRFDKKPQYRYSGCHSYDTSALNIALGVRFGTDSNKYTYHGGNTFFYNVSLEQASAMLRDLELNTTTDGGVTVGRPGAADTPVSV